jgi:leucine-zipper of insertion element IS481
LETRSVHHLRQFQRINRYRVGGLDGLKDRSHRPHHCPHQLAALVEAKVCELRRQHPGWGRNGCGMS